MSEIENYLAEQIADCVSELQLIRDVLDELRVDLQWAVQNDKIANHDCDYISKASVQIERAADAILRLPGTLKESPGDSPSELFETQPKTASNENSTNSTTGSKNNQLGLFDLN